MMTSTHRSRPIFYMSLAVSTSTTTRVHTEPQPLAAFVWAKPHEIRHSSIFQKKKNKKLRVDTIVEEVKQTLLIDKLINFCFVGWLFSRREDGDWWQGIECEETQVVCRSYDYQRRSGRWCCDAIVTDWGLVRERCRKRRPGREGKERGWWQLRWVKLAWHFLGC